jgi:signal transduction histidine kinase
VARFPRGEKLDLWVAVGLTVAAQIDVWTSNDAPGPKWAVAPIALLITGSVAVRRRLPLAVTCIASIGFITLLFAGGSGTQQSVPIGIAWLCAMYALAVWTDAREFVIGCCVFVASNLILLLRPSSTLSDAAFFTIVPGLAILLTRSAVRSRQVRADALAARAEMLEREHELRTNEALAEERARIARELHDLVAHNVSLMVVQAGAERHALGEDQANTREALASIETAGRQALTEARRLLGVLRRKDEREELEPQPSVDHIDILIEHVQRAGLPVTLTVEGKRVPLPAGLDLCAYRVVQEGLTNALKHAGQAHAEVLLHYATSALDIEVRDDGRGPARTNGASPGHGLIGMRERVALYDGTLEAGPRPGGGFQIRAHLPLG